MTYKPNRIEQLSSKFRITMVANKNKLFAVVILSIIFLIRQNMILKNENQQLSDSNTRLEQTLKLEIEKSAIFQINLYEMQEFYNRCVMNSKKTSQKLRKIEYIHHKLKQNFKALITKLKSRINSFQIKGGDCDMFSFLKKTYEKFKNFF